MLYSEKLSEAVRSLSGKISTMPDVAIILGSGLGSVAESVEGPKVIRYDSSGTRRKTRIRKT